MKKVFMSLCVLAMALMMVSCGSDSNTPSAVAEKYMKCAIDQDVEGLINLMYFGDDVTKEQKDAFVAILKASMKSEDNELGKLKDEVKDFKVLEEKIDGDKAVVKLEATNKDGEKDTQEVKMKKDKDGNWLIDAGK